MCGIAGIAGGKQADAGALMAMHDGLLHRGPDSEGFYAKGAMQCSVRRLKVIDPEGGDQPLFNETNDIVVILNGEIYNHRTLRTELVAHGHRFSSRSDTEVLVHGYEQWGIEGLLSRIDGMYAFALWDEQAQKLLLARDRFGEKPLYYWTDGRRLLFASELQALLASGIPPFTIDPEALNAYVALHYVPGDRTMIRGVRKLLPGHVLEWSETKHTPRISPYWKPTTQEHVDDYGAACRTVRSLIEESVRSRLKADVPVGVFLSGGVDSSIVTAIAAKHLPSLSTFSMGFAEQEYDESDAAKTVAAFLGTSHHHRICTEDDVVRALDDVIAHMDEPCGDQALLPTYLLSRLASEHVTVVLGGEGADELFGGYSYYPNGTSHANLQNTLRSGFPLLTDAETRRNLCGGKGERFFASLDFPSDPDPLRAAQLTDIRTWLPHDLLLKFDRMTSAFSLEGRAPYLSPTLATYALSLPTSYKRNNGVVKRILRDACRDLLPESILRREKHGFVVPMASWLRGRLRGRLLESTTLRQDDGIDPVSYGNLLERHVRGEDCTRVLFALWMYKLWFHDTSSRLRRLSASSIARSCVPAG